MGEGVRPIGASTITQQVAKNMLLDNQVSIARKAKEAILAMRIDHSLTKQRVLELYLNEICRACSRMGLRPRRKRISNNGLDQA